MLAPIRWLAQNLSTLLLAFILSIVVWVSAVITSDPNEVHIFQLNMEKVGQDTGLLLVSETSNQVRLTLQVPRSIWNQINNNPNLVHSWIDLTGLESGVHKVKVKARVDLEPTRFLQIDPPEVEVALEKLESKSLPVTIQITGEPPLGYRKGTPQATPAEVTVSGPQTIVSKVAQVRANLRISGASQSIQEVISVNAVDESGSSIPGATITPKTVNVVQPINLLGGFKNVVVKVVTRGQVANGYRLTNISVVPPNVTIFSSSQSIIEELPGYVETVPVDLTGLTDKVDRRVDLSLHPQVAMVGEQSVLVQIGVAAIESSLTVSLPVEALGVSPDLQAQISPATVDVIVSGPLPVLDKLTPASFRIVVNLADMGPGSYPLTPVVDLKPDQVQVQAILPESVEVNITLAPTVTPTFPFSIQPSPRPTTTPAQTDTPAP